jgi:hypothetical protein
MKKRIFAGAVLLFMGGLLASACDDGEADYYVVEPSVHSCRHFTTCGTCTPVEGCGWCQTGPGQGTCATDPDECAGSSAFSWTWDPSGCVGGTSSTTTDAGSSSSEDAGQPTAVDASPQLEDADQQGLH